MVTVTEQAIQLLKEIQKDHEESANQDGAFQFAFDERREDDQIVQSDETDVLLVGTDVTELLGDATIDCQDTPAGPRFTLDTRKEPPA
jgi:Fe-S cluster assembly iron-binding protein IscA